MTTPILKELFPAFADFIEAAPNVDSTATYGSLNATAISTRKTIVDIISQPVWDKIKVETDSEALMYLRSAWANRTMYGQKIFVAVDNRLTKKGDTYKYELEAMKRQYIDNYHNAMDSLLRILSENASYGWASSWFAKQMQGLKLKALLDFQAYYYIDTSYLYFIRTVPIQKKELLLTFSSYYDKISEREDLLENLNLALVYTIIARTLQQFDIIELPPTIRNYFDDNTLSRNGIDERDAVNNMANNFLSDATDLLGNIDLALTQNSDNIDTGTNLNDDDNKYYLMT